ncbi:MAG: type II toxin-antitoxin system VapB family antitoxin [Acidimicrobiales bacterium]
MRTVVDIDEDSLREARLALGTTTKVETVNRALVEVAALAARRRDLRRLVRGDLAALVDEDLYQAAWR